MPTPPPPAVLSLRQLSASGARPFPSHPQVDRYFPAAAIEDSRRRLTRAIDRGDGPGLIIGAAGTGKSLLLQAIAAQYQERLDVVLLACARLCSRRALLQAILFELGMPFRLRDEGQLRFGLLDHLLSARPAPTDLLLLIDEAQTLSIALLDELRIMTNLVQGGAPRVRLVLAGAPALEESFASPELESLSQRLAARCYLAPWTRDETMQFVRAQLAACGAATEEIVRPEALDAVFEATDGVPRLVNQLCDRALTIADAENCVRIDRRVIQAAWSDLQRLPTPWEGRPTAVETGPASPGVIEFGRLDEGEATAEPAAPFAESRADSNRTQVVESSRTAAAAASRNGVAACSPQFLKPAMMEMDTANPFAEPFAEEEVVLDNFAAWSAVLEMGTPRVENRRDRHFTSLVHAALKASDASDAAARTCNLARSTSVHIEGWEVTEVEPGEELLPLNDADPRWPPIRLAVVGEAAPVAPSGLPRGSAGAADPLESLCGLGSDEPPLVEPPILIVEGETLAGEPSRADSPPPAQVRRHDYRHLFSRLRSG